MLRLRVIEGGFMTRIQDAGRFGFQHLGVPASVPMDKLAYMAAHALVGNDHEAALLEFTLIGPELVVEMDCLVALTGSGYTVSIDGVPQADWTTLSVKAGATITVTKTGTGVWGYLAFSGGIQVPPVLNSRTAYLKGGFDGLAGRSLVKGDVLPLGDLPAGKQIAPGANIPRRKRPNYAQFPRLDTLQGPQVLSFSFSGVNTFYGSPYEVTAASDRMGYRLDGPAIKHKVSADILSDGLQPGSVQVPANGQPIVMMGDCATSGGYTKIASLTTYARTLLAQCEPGESRVTFGFTSIETAQSTLRQCIAEVTTPVMPDDEDDLLKYAGW